MRLFGALLLSGFLMEITSTFIMFIEQGLITNPRDQICKKPIFIILNGIAYVMIYVFLVISKIISNNVQKFLDLNAKNQQNRAYFEKSEQVRELKKANKKLW